MSEHAASRALSAARHEPKDIGIRFMLAFLAGIACVLLLLMGIALWIYPKASADQRFTTPLPSFPPPQLQPDPTLDWQTFYAGEMGWLNGTGWVDRTAGTVHIPISQAMKAVAAEGIPGWPAGNPNVSQGDRR